MTLFNPGWEIAPTGPLVDKKQRKYRFQRQRQVPPLDTRNQREVPADERIQKILEQAFVGVLASDAKPLFRVGVGGGSGKYRPPTDGNQIGVDFSGDLPSQGHRLVIMVFNLQFNERFQDGEFLVFENDFAAQYGRKHFPALAPDHLFKAESV
ncbi:MAG: hypothetical protein JXB25_02325 [Deltaproteobacteria bacterium]|nr:hypothetical protein [Deltaproteobacteria bacterium]